MIIGVGSNANFSRYFARFAVGVYFRAKSRNVDIVVSSSANTRFSQFCVNNFGRNQVCVFENFHVEGGGGNGLV